MDHMVTAAPRHGQTVVPLVQTKSVSVHFAAGPTILGGSRRHIKAVDDVTLAVGRGSILGVVGESGCGKSTLARALIGLRKPTSGHVVFDGEDVAGVKKAALRRLRKRMQIVFQDPYASLNPRFTVQKTIAEPIIHHRLRSSRHAVEERVAQLLELVGLRANAAHRFPHEFSGGQRQRISIARALAVEPELIVCDEPISALDVSIQAQILNLLLSLREELDLTYVFVAHDLAVVRRMCTDVAVMYLGRVVEMGKRDDVYNTPRHPYTVALLDAVPSIADATTGRRKIVLSGDLPSAADDIEGCPFRQRCWLYLELGQPERCSAVKPLLAPAGLGTHEAACHYADEVQTRADQRRAS